MLAFNMEDSHFKCTLCSKKFKKNFHLNRHMLTHQDAKHSCQKCGKSFHRTDVFSKHQAKCSAGDKTCNLCDSTFSQKSSMTRHKKMCGIKSTRNKVIKASEAYNKRIKRGKILEEILRKYPDTIEEALNSGDKEALRIYQSSCVDNIDVESITLKPWQKDVITLIDNPSVREIYWLVGEDGNEGKTFIQAYINRVFGCRRVLKSELSSRKVDIAYVLSGESLTCKDIFLFNLLRSDYSVSYGILENIKDGYLVSAKYKSKSIKLKTPNTVIVFSNSYPSINQLSSDRWNIMEIKNDNLFKDSRLANFNKPELRNKTHGKYGKLGKKVDLFDSKNKTDPETTDDVGKAYQTYLNCMVD